MTITTVSPQEKEPFKLAAAIREIAAFLNTFPSQPQLGGWYQNANLNSANTDHEIRIKSPTTNWVLHDVIIKNKGTTASITTATAGLFTATAGGGTALAATQSLSVLTTNAVNTAGGIMHLTLSANNQWQSRTSLYFRVATAQGAAATADVYVRIIPLPDVPPAL